MLYTGGCDTCYMQEVVIHVICRRYMLNTGDCDMLYAGGCDMLNAGGCDTCYIQGGCDTCYIQEIVIQVQEVVIHVIYRRL